MTITLKNLKKRCIKIKMLIKNSPLLFTIFIILSIFPIIIQDSYICYLFTKSFNFLEPKLDLLNIVYLLIIIVFTLSLIAHKYTFLQSIWMILLPVMVFGLYNYNNNCIPLLYEHKRALFILCLTYLFGPLYSIISINSNSKKRNPTSKEYLIDKPIELRNQDLFNRERLAKAISNKINAFTKIENTFSIAITGEWGSGKTSFMNLLSEQLKQNERNIIVKFNPWTAHHDKTLIEKLLAEILSNLNSLDNITTINNSIQNYFDTISIDSSSLITKSLKFILSSNKANVSLKYKNKISKALIEEGRLLIIFVDDMDRLEKKEISEMLQLIRNTTDFENTIYISGFDENYVNEAIKDINTYANKQYLDKIFQLKFNLPARTLNLNNLFRKSLINSLIDSINYTNADITILYKIHDYFLEKNVLYSSIIKYRPILNSVKLEIRDIIKIVNSFSTIYPIIREDIHFGTLLNVEIIKTKFPILYNFLRDERELVLRLASSDSSVVYSNNTSTKASVAAENGILNKLEKLISPQESQNYIEIIKNLIYIKEDFEFNFQNSLNYSRYFHLDYLDRQIKYSEFEELIIKKEDDLLFELELLYNENRYKDFEFKLSKNLDKVKSITQFYSLFNAIVDLNIKLFQPELFFPIYSREILLKFFKITEFRALSTLNHNTIKEKLIDSIKEKNLILLLKLLHEDVDFTLMKKKDANILIEELFTKYWNNKKYKLKPFRYFLYVASVRLNNYKVLVEKCFNDNPIGITLLSFHYNRIDDRYEVREQSAINKLFNGIPNYTSEINKIKNNDIIKDEIIDFLNEYSKTNKPIKFKFKALPINEDIAISKFNTL